MICVYIIEHTSTGMFYIGSTINFNKRKLDHLSKLKKNTHASTRLQDVYNLDPVLVWYQYPLNSEVEARLLERNAIKCFASNPNICNMHGSHHTRPLKVKQKIAASKIGSIASSSTRLKMSLKRTGTKKSAAWSDKIAESRRQLTMVEGKRFNSIKETAAFYNLNVTTVWRRIISTNPKFSDWCYIEPK